MFGIIKLVIALRKHDHRPTRPHAFGRCADTALMNDQVGAWKQCSVIGVTDDSNIGARNFPPIRQMFFANHDHRANAASRRRLGEDPVWRGSAVNRRTSQSEDSRRRTGVQERRQVIIERRNLSQRKTALYRFGGPVPLCGGEAFREHDEIQMG